MKKYFSRRQMDAIKEVASIGAGNAATALSQMLKKKVTIDIPRTSLCRIEEASSIFGDAEMVVTAVYLRLLGDATGVILFSFRQDEACKLADLLLDYSAGTITSLDELHQSAVKETATILSGAYLSAVAKLLNMRLLISSPAICHDMSGAIVDNILIETSQNADFAIVMDTELNIVDEKVMAYFFFIPDIESTVKILKTMGVNDK